MKKFEFSLKKLQRYKQQILDREKGILAGLQKTKQQLEQQIEELERFRAEKTQQLNDKQKKGMSSAELAGYRFFQDNIRHQIAGLQQQLKELQVQLDAQIEIVMKASQEMKSIDKQEEKPLEEYKLEVSRAQSEEISEFITMKL